MPQTNTAANNHERMMSLAQCHEHMRADPRIGEKSPSLITLKRWSSAGRLKPAMRPRRTQKHQKRSVSSKNGLKPESKRPRHAYDLESVIQITMEALADRFAAHAGVAPAPTAPTAPTAHSPSLSMQAVHRRAILEVDAEVAPRDPGQEAALSQILAFMRELAAEVKRHAVLIEGGLADLAATRRMLMNKYDSERTAMSARMEEISQRNAVLEKSAVSIDVPKLNSLLARISDQLTQFTGASGSANNKERP